MLILSRRMDEAITIGDEIEVLIIGIKDGRVQLGIRAPRDIVVYRNEVASRISELERKGENDGDD